MLGEKPHKPSLLYTAPGMPGAKYSLAAFGAILGASALATVNTQSIQGATHDVISYAREIFYSTAADEYDTVFLEVVTFPGNVSNNLLAVRKTDPCYFP